MSERDQGERAGVGPGYRRPSRRMRERAEEMADLLAQAAPRVRERRRRRSVGIPAAAVALGALTVGGVGVAVGPDAEPSDTAVALPSGPSSPGQDAAADAPGVRPTTSAVADVPVGEDEADDRADAGDRRAADRDAADGTTGPAARAQSSPASDGPARSTPRRPIPQRPTPRRPIPQRSIPEGPRTTTGADGAGKVSESPREATSSTPRGEGDASDDRGRSGRDGSDSSPAGSDGDSERATDLRAEGRGTSAVLPSRSPTGDDG